MTGISVKAAAPMTLISFRRGAWEKSGPPVGGGPGRMGTQAMEGMAKDTPLRRYCRSLMTWSFIWTFLASGGLGRGLGRSEPPGQLRKFSAATPGESLTLIGGRTMDGCDGDWIIVTFLVMSAA